MKDLRELAFYLLQHCIVTLGRDWGDAELYEDARSLLGLVECARCNGTGEITWGLEEVRGTCPKCDGMAFVLPDEGPPAGRGT